MNTHELILSNIKKYREIRKISASEFSKLANFKYRGYIHQIETKKRHTAKKIRVDTIIKIVQVLNITISSLFEEKVEEHYFDKFKDKTVKELLINFSKNVKRRRESLKYTATEIDHKAKLCKSRISNLEKFRWMHSNIEVNKRIADALETTIEDLLLDKLTQGE